jgi:predicted transcriptional regulator
MNVAGVLVGNIHDRTHVRPIPIVLTPYRSVLMKQIRDQAAVSRRELLELSARATVQRAELSR